MSPTGTGRAARCGPDWGYNSLEARCAGVRDHVGAREHRPALRGLSYAPAGNPLEHLVPKRSRKPAASLGIFECVRLPDGRIGRVRGRRGALVKVRVRRATSTTHQFVMCPLEELKRVPCPKGWMSPEGYRRYLRVTLQKMRERHRRGSRSRPDPSEVALQHREQT